MSRFAVSFFLAWIFILQVADQSTALAQSQQVFGDNYSYLYPEEIKEIKKTSNIAASMMIINDNGGIRSKLKNNDFEQISHREYVKNYGTYRVLVDTTPNIEGLYVTRFVLKIIVCDETAPLTVSDLRVGFGEAIVPGLRGGQYQEICDTLWKLNAETCDDQVVIKKTLRFTSRPQRRTNAAYSKKTWDVEIRKNYLHLFTDGEYSYNPADFIENQ